MSDAKNVSNSQRARSSANVDVWPNTLIAWRNTGTRLMLLGVLVGGSGPAMATIFDYPFRLTARAAGAGHQAVAENNGPVSISVNVVATGKHFASEQNWPITMVVPPFTVVPLGGVRPDAGRYDFNFAFSYHFGRIDAEAQPNSTYRLPFADGLGFKVTQADDGELTTHNSRAMQYAIDFAMPIGTAVLAARDGIVADVTLRYRDGANDASLTLKANAISIVHDDGTVAEYVHLSPGPATVAVGERVAAGALLGYSGNTGYTSGPHLHFSVSRPGLIEGKVTMVSVPLWFGTSDPAVRFVARAGTTVWANHGNTITVDARPPGKINAGPESVL